MSAAAFAPTRLSIAVTFAGVVLGCAVTLAFCTTRPIAGNAASGFWLPVLANWGRRVARRRQARAVRPHDKRLRALSISRFRSCSAPSSSICGKSRCAALACPSVLFPAPSAIAVRFASARCGCSGRTSSRLSFSACSPAMSSVAAPVFSSPFSLTAILSSAADCCRSAISSRLCRSSASRRSW